MVLFAKGYVNLGQINVLRAQAEMPLGKSALKVRP